MSIKAFKAFTSPLTNKELYKFKLNYPYQLDGTKLAFGEYGYGFHMTSSLADTFRFFNPINNNDYCEVIGDGKIIQIDNFYFDSKPMYVAEKMIITKILTRQDILDYVYQADVDEFRRFLALFPFTKEEVQKLQAFYHNNSQYLELFKYFENEKNIEQEFRRNPIYLRKTKKY